MHGAALFVGLLLVSTAGPFIVQSGVAAPAIVWWRAAIAAALFLMHRRGFPKAHRRAVLWGGALMAAHFLLWIQAFELTTFASNLLLLISQPVLAVVVGARLGYSVSRAAWGSLGVALVGLLAIAGADIDLGPRALLGDAMCILACLAIAVFYFVTHRARKEMHLSAFMGWMLLSCAVCALPFALLPGSALWGYQPEQWGWLLGLVALATMGGHGLMNYAARGVSMFAVNIVVVLEPFLSIVLGALMFGAQLTGLQAVGGAVLAAAVTWGLYAEHRRQAVALPG